jgi:hypothetical protein
MNCENFNSKLISDILNNRFDQIPSLKDCYKDLMARNEELLKEAAEEMEENKKKCKTFNEYTPEDIRRALRFHNCLLCSLNAFL